MVAPKIYIAIFTTLEFVKLKIIFRSGIKGTIISKVNGLIFPKIKNPVISGNNIMSICVGHFCLIIITR